MECVSSLTYQILINGSPHGHVVPTRGLRQGDPLSPYLFVICTELLIIKLKEAEGSGLISGVKIARNAPPITHLLFADDSLLYCKGNKDEVEQLDRVLKEYTQESGQQINFQKSSILFGKRFPENKRLEIKLKLGIHREGGEEKYLGLPEMFSRSKVQTLSFLKEKLNKRIGSWQSKFLSQGGKEVMLKAVAFALPTYSMTCFRLPKTTCKLLASSMADFWWKNKLETKGLHWKAWSALSKSKEEGGLGFRDIKDFNTALLGKQLWRILTRKDSLLARVYQSRYFPKSDCLNAPLGSRPSYAWRGLHSAQELIRAGARIEVGDGRSIDIWKDPWLGFKPAHPLHITNRIPLQLQHGLSRVKVVGDLLQDQSREWNTDTLRLLVPEETITVIKAIRPGGINTIDSFMWDYSRSGLYTVKSAYWLQHSVLSKQKDGRAIEINQPSLNPLFKQLWKVDSSPKIKHFLWRCLTNSLSVAGNLATRHVTNDASCLRCPHLPESVNHLLFTCSYARLVWAISPIPNPPEGAWGESLFSNIHRTMNLALESEEGKCFDRLTPWLLWRLWKSRNELVFKGSDADASFLVQKAIEDAEEWKKRKEGMEVTAGGVMSRGRERKWERPPVGWVKCNSDGAWSRNGKSSGIGWVLRDHTGRVLWIGARALVGMRDIFDVEAEALRWAMVSLDRLGYDKIMFESDSKNLVDVIRETKTGEPTKPVIQDIRVLVERMKEASVVFVARECNHVADCVAKKAMSEDLPDPVLFSVVPLWVKNLVLHDVRVSRLS